ncbi:MAG: hypothetical protein AAB581_00275, partial [Patescibacteria group bacterium]
GKMLYYGISEGLIRRVIHSPKRTEEGIAPGTVAVMQPTHGKKKQEVWVMYAVAGTKKRIITAWRYPGVSPVRSAIPIPEGVLAELLESGELLITE